MNPRIFGLLVLLFAAGAQAASYNDIQPCEPFDPNGVYHDIHEAQDQVLRGTVERNHFTKPVATLQHGQTAPLPRDIAFVLRYFPNHYLALNAMGRWQLMHRLDPGDAESPVWTADCYFQRAIDFRPDDATIHLIYAIYLHGAKRYADASKQYAAAEENGADNAEFYYNRGLLAVDMGNLDEAQKDADKAYSMGAPLPGLRDKLARAQKQVGQGKKPVSSVADPAKKR
jgi:tetratricopeptide (TPR) repeat protein